MSRAAARVVFIAVAVMVLLFIAGVLLKHYVGGYWS